MRHAEGCKCAGDGGYGAGRVTADVCKGRHVWCYGGGMKGDGEVYASRLLCIYRPAARNEAAQCAIRSTLKQICKM